MTTTNQTTGTTVSVLNIAAQKATVVAQYKALIAGIDSGFADTATFVLNNVTLSRADLLAKFQSRLDAAEKTKADRTTLHASVAAEQAVDAAVAPVRMAFKGYLQSRYGRSAAALQKYGFSPDKKPQRTVAGKSAAVAGAKATRAARSTKGRKQRAAIKGTPAATP